MTGILSPSSSNHLFLCEDIHAPYWILDHIFNVPYIKRELSLSLAESLTFHVELSGLRTCSSACPALCAGRQCLSGLVTERPAAVRFPVWSFNEDVEKVFTTYMWFIHLIHLQRDLPVRDHWVVCSVWAAPPLSGWIQSPHGSWEETVTLQIFC